jgi:putative transcriptional regulator
VTSNANEHIPGNPLDTLLASYARGRLSPPLHVLVASHLVIQPSSRSFVRALEEVGGAELLKTDPIEVPDRDDRLAAIFASDQGSLETTRSSAFALSGDDVLPRPLARYLGRTISDIKWRTLLPGVKEFRVEDNEDGEATLYWIRSGRKMPSHTHEGSEFTLVLKGAFSDLNGHYGPGDIAIADMDIDHRPIADEGEDCFCFAVTDAPLQLTGPIGRIVQRLFKKH